VGGEVRVKGVNPEGRPWRIGIDKPLAGLGREIQAVATPCPQSNLPAIATSGNYRNRFIDANGHTRVHTIDPLTGLPAEGDVLSVSIAAESCAFADALATGLMAARTMKNVRRLLGAGNLQGVDLKNFEYYIIYSSMEVLQSPGFPLAREDCNARK
jgi:thiamine biosynthesis lipoprotein